MSFVSQHTPTCFPRRRSLLGLFGTSLAALAIALLGACSDDSDLSGHTMELKWFKRLGDYLILRQLFRYYKQNAADFYRITLDGSGIEPVPQPDGSGPHYYSSDYRISKLEALTLGIKLTVLINDNLSIDLSYDRYEMNGLDGQTSQLVYPSANVLTVGMQSLF